MQVGKFEGKNLIVCVYCYVCCNFNIIKWEWVLVCYLVLVYNFEFCFINVCVLYEKIIKINCLVQLCESDGGV